MSEHVFCHTHLIGSRKHLSSHATSSSSAVAWLLPSRQQSGRPGFESRCCTTAALSPELLPRHANCMHAMPAQTTSGDYPISHGCLTHCDLSGLFCHLSVFSKAGLPSTTQTSRWFRERVLPSFYLVGGGGWLKGDDWGHSGCLDVFGSWPASQHTRASSGDRISARKDSARGLRTTREPLSLATAEANWQKAGGSQSSSGKRTYSPR